VFVRGRQILDYVLIPNEYLDSGLRFGEPGVLCKLDIDEAYDHVKLGVLIIFVEEIWFWGDMTFLDRVVFL
jgi:hypothetical protein